MSDGVKEMTIKVKLKGREYEFSSVQELVEFDKALGSPAQKEAALIKEEPTKEDELTAEVTKLHKQGMGMVNIFAELTKRGYTTTYHSIVKIVKNLQETKAPEVEAPVERRFFKRAKKKGVEKASQAEVIRTTVFDNLKATKPKKVSEIIESLDHLFSKAKTLKGKAGLLQRALATFPKVKTKTISGTTFYYVHGQRTMLPSAREVKQAKKETKSSPFHKFKSERIKYHMKQDNMAYMDAYKAFLEEWKGKQKAVVTPKKEVVVPEWPEVAGIVGEYSERHLRKVVADIIQSKGRLTFPQHGILLDIRSGIAWRKFCQSLHANAERVKSYFNVPDAKIYHTQDERGYDIIQAE